jgi:hypothetical protein
MSVKNINTQKDSLILTKESGLNFFLQGTGIEELDKAIEMAGYAYDPIQDIFFSTMNPWQRSVGYCRLYDEAAAPLGMIIDSEHIFFEYQGKKWIISFWKGQYDMVTGCEIGIYTEAADLNLPGIFNGSFYKSISDSQLLPMSCTLYKNGKLLFTREGRHWWLTGFKLGEFSEPSELTMNILITLENEIMRDAFISGLKSAGYPDRAFSVSGNTVQTKFDVPYTRQPFSRTKDIARIVQRKNEQLCKKYHEITQNESTFTDKVKILQEQAPELFEQILIVGKNKKSYEMFIELIIFGTFLLSKLTRK